MNFGPQLFIIFESATLYFSKYFQNGTHVNLNVLIQVCLVINVLKKSFNFLDVFWLSEKEPVTNESTIQCIVNPDWFWYLLQLTWTTSSQFICLEMKKKQDLIRREVLAFNSHYVIRSCYPEISQLLIKHTSDRYLMKFSNIDDKF